jgi:hypothetical protein
MLPRDDDHERPGALGRRVPETIRDLEAGRIAGKAAVAVRPQTGVNAGGVTARE